MTIEQAFKEDVSFIFYIESYEQKLDLIKLKEVKKLQKRH